MNWQYNEFQHVGKDYSKHAEAEQYNRRHAEFRDIEDESNKVLDTLNIQKDQVLIDLGTGTGIFASLAAKRGAQVYGVDVAEAMLEQAKARAKDMGAAITFINAGFLGYKHEGPPADFVTTTLAFHHIPDFWKGIALKNINAMLKPGGTFYMHDVIIEEENAVENIDALIDHFTKETDAFTQHDANGHFKKEYSTYDWIIDGLLERAGFTIEDKTIEKGLMATYYCSKG